MENAHTEKTYFQFEFTGKTREYFGIWIVNILLTILTLGIYSAWAKVRNNRYFYGNTLLDGDAFEYTADPVKILKGRLIAVAFLIIYSVTGEFSVTLAAIVFIVGMLFLPAVVVLAMRFRTRYTNWRGISFGFKSDFKTAYLLFLPLILFLILAVLLPTMMGIDTQNAQDVESMPEEDIAAFSAKMQTYGLVIGSLFLLGGLLFPWWHAGFYQFIVKRARFGTTFFDLPSVIKNFYRMYLMAALIFIIGIFVAIGGVFGNAMSTVGSSIGTSILFGLLLILVYVWPFAYIQANRANIVYTNMAAGKANFLCTLSTGKLLGYYVSNALAIILTLGLAIPWAKIRLARYRAECMQAYTDNFEDFSGMLEAEKQAMGEEVTEMFDIDLGI